LLNQDLHLHFNHTDSENANLATDIAKVAKVIVVNISQY